MADRTTKDIAGRIEPTYHRRMHPLRRTRRILSASLCVIGALWAALGGDSMHANGALASAHAPFERNCAECHEGNFQAISEDSCVNCHPVDAHSEEPAPACAECHRDHRGRLGLAAVADAHCNRCHEGHKSIADFASHVDFATKAREQNLAFSHRRHLDAKLQEGPLVCADCHVKHESGFNPIAFNRHCVRCHTERVDDEFPKETVPHGFQPEALRDWVTAVYLRQGIVDLDRSRNAAAALFDPERERGCLICHTMQDGKIVAPAIPDRWQTKARFDHRPHRNTQCAHCHEMTASEKAADLKLPGIATCRECHSPKAAPATCATCHQYHVLNTLWR
ncbi:MAG: cytochrome c3 family protein [Planctomycetota bacterium]|jgi:predicted CXXCH cytochrome family protein